MSRTISPLKAASLGIMLVGLWLIVLGVWKTLGLLYTFQDASTLTSHKGTSVAVILIVLWKTLPLWVGIALFRGQRTLVHLFYGRAITEEDERNHWNDTQFLSTLVLGLLGVFLVARGLDQFCQEQRILSIIVQIDDPTTRRSVIWDLFYWEHVISILFPVILGVIFVLGAGRIGDIMGYRIEKSLEESLEREDDSP